MATKDTVVQELVVNTLTHKQFKVAQEAGTLSPYELYGTPDTSVRLPVLTPMWFDHLANDVSWLRADSFSWHSGDVYVAAYEHLADDYESIEKDILYAWNWTMGDEIVYTKTSNPSVGDVLYNSNSEVLSYSIVEMNDGTMYINESSAGGRATRQMSSDIDLTIKTDTIGDITISYYQAQDGHKICLPDQESNISALYEATGAADYYLLDTTNKQFKLPRKQKRRLIQAVKNTDNTWYNMYSDGWVEQGGFLGGSWTGARTFNLPVAMSDTGYTVTNTVGCPNISGMNGLNWLTGRTKTSITFTSRSLAGNFETNNFSWQVNGYAAESAYASAGMQLEYYYVGNYTQDAVEQTAGVASEALNNKLDIGAGNATDETKTTIVGWGTPDYTSGVTVANQTEFIAPSAGALYLYGSTYNDQSIDKITINGITLNFGQANANTININTSFFFVDKGDIVLISFVRTQSSATFFPLKGVN